LGQADVEEESAAKPLIEHLGLTKSSLPSMAAKTTGKVT
jgi:hypothetical protein